LVVWLVLGSVLIAAAVVTGCQERGAGRAAQTAAGIALQPGLRQRELIFPDGWLPMCHASTIVEAQGALVCAWFAGTHEGAPDVAIWLSRREPGGGWSGPVQVADGVQADRSRYPCWNPVLFQPARGPLLLFYQVGPNPRAWWGMLKTSPDGGRTWSVANRLPAGQSGPIKNKPIELVDGSLLCPTSTEEPGLHLLNDGWRVFVSSTPDLGRTWSTVGPLNDVDEFAAIQPTILRHADGRLRLLCRTQQGVIAQVVSSDQGRSWGPMTRTSLPNPNSGCDAVTLRDGRHLLVYNHTTHGRAMLNVAVSGDGEHWQAALLLEDEPGEFSYPAVIESDDGLVHVTYTWKRRSIRHAVIDPVQLVARDLVDGAWPHD
jgi:predicted neuraminidase